MNKIVLVDPKVIKIHPELAACYAMGRETVEALTESMRERGFDSSFPVLIWAEKGYLIDGHTRRKAAISAYIPRIPAEMRSFPNLEAVKDFINRVQLHRRNLSLEDKIKLILANPEYKHAKNKKKFIANALQCSEASAGRYLSTLSNPEKLAKIIGKKGAEKAEKLIKKRKKGGALCEKDKIFAKFFRFFAFFEGVDPEIAREFAEKYPEKWEKWAKIG